ncbi:hypothetical protein FOA52_008768 [Chlamydomonas sp. UWO 241]|nr:hypothetical protein FOA52_008768 [Chlamydomonas sp. UWO 241]
MAHLAAASSSGLASARAWRRGGAAHAVSPARITVPSTRVATTALCKQEQQHRAAVSCKASGLHNGVYMFGGLFGGGNNNNYDNDDDYDEDFTVIKLQVGLFGDVNKFQKRLDDIADKYDTTDQGQLHQVYKDALMLVLRNMSYVGYACSAGKVFGDLDEAEQKFNSVLLEERLKFEEETLVNVDGRKKKRSSGSSGADVGLDRWLCMSMLMCLDGKIKVPPIRTALELKQVLTKLGGMTAEGVVAFELLWTPQETDDAYSKDELLTDYPDMITLT